MRVIRLCFPALCLFTVSTVSGQDLLVNGGFESGNTGWTSWAAGWSAGHNWDFSNAEGGHAGAAALKLTIDGSASFGVYQEVAVTPGTTYRLDAWWKGTRYSNDNWYEILLLDGPWDEFQADTGGAVVYDNFMYGYDSGTYPLPGDFGWIWAHDQNGTQVDWNNRNGERTATGNVMTVVLKAGACCSTTQAEAWFDEVSLIEVAGVPGDCTSFVNGDFSEQLNNWNTWVEQDTGGDMLAGVTGGELDISGTHFNGGVYQQFNTGGAGTVVNVMGAWKSGPTVSDGQWAEVLIINADRVPTDGIDEVDGVNDVIRLYANDTFDGRGAWDNAIPLSSPVAYESSFVAAGDKATIILKAGSNGTGVSGVQYDDIGVHCVPPPATVDNLPEGFEARTYVFPGGTGTNVVSIAQSPISRRLYIVRNGNGDTLYELNVDGPALSVTTLENLDVYGLVGGAQGLTFDPSGNIYVSSRRGDIVKGVDTNPDPAIDDFSFSRILNLPEQHLGTFHGVGGLAVGPDNLLYINSGSQSFYGYLEDGTPEVYLPEYDPDTGTGWWNARILRCSLDGGIDTVDVFAEGIRNTFDIAFRADGALFGVENGPNEECHYAEELNILEFGSHYGFPYKYGSDLSGSDSSIVCQNAGGGNQVGPPPLPAEITPRPAMANYGPDAVPIPGQGGYADGGPYWGFDPHSGPDGIDFYNPDFMDAAAIKFPKEFHGRAFVSRLGQLEAAYVDRGRDLLTLRIDDAHEGFICNYLLTNLGRAVDVLCAHNGKVYVLEFDQSTSGPGIYTSNSRVIELAYTIPADEPNIVLSTSQIAVTADLGINPPIDTFTVTNNGGATMVYTVEDDADWLTVSPTSGTNTGELDPIELTYDVSGLTCGVYSAVVMVTDPNALNVSQQVAVELTVKTVSGDFDCDGDVDQSDYGHLQACYTGAGVVVQDPDCLDTSLDSDQDVDLLDHEVFVACQSGAGIPADPTCDDAWE